jgi:hypothetical protein
MSDPERQRPLLRIGPDGMPLFTTDPNEGYAIPTEQTPVFAPGSLAPSISQGPQRVPFPHLQGGASTSPAVTPPEAAIEAPATPEATTPAPTTRRAQRSAPAAPIPAPEPTPEEVKAQEGLPFDYGAPNQYEEVAQGESTRTTDLGKTAFDVGVARAERLQTAAQELQENASAILEARAQAHAEMEEAQEAARARAEALFSQQFDPSRIYHSPDAAASAGVHLGVAVGHMIQQFTNMTFPGTNGQNPAMRIVENAIERDIAQQREMFTRGQAQLRQDSAFMEGMRALNNDQVASLEFARTAAQENVATQLESIAAMYEGTQVSVGLRNTADQLRRGVMDRRMQIQMQMAALAAQQARRGGARTEEPMGIAIDRSRFAVSTDPAMADNVAEFTGLKHRERAEILDQLDSHDDMLRLLTTLDDLIARGEAGNFTVDQDVLGRVSETMMEITARYSSTNHLGSMDEGLQTLLERGLGSPSDFFERASTMHARLRSQMRTQRSRMGAIQRRYGIDSVGLGRQQEPTTAELVENRVGHLDTDTPTSRLQDARNARASSFSEEATTRRAQRAQSRLDSGDILGALGTAFD